MRDFTSLSPNIVFVALLTFLCESASLSGSLVRLLSNPVESEDIYQSSYLPSFVPSKSANLTEFSCLPNSKRWFLGDVVAGGYTNQLFGVYSMIPVALLLNASLIVGPLFTRHSFSHSWNEFSLYRHVLIPFSYFYDFSHFASHWKREKNLDVVEKHTAGQCLNYSTFVHINRKDFWSKSDNDLIKYVNDSNIPLPIPENYTKLTMTGACNLVALYDYWQSEAHLKLLLKMDESLRPNVTLVHVIDAIMSRLGDGYIAVHLRVEADAIPHKPSIDEYNRTVDKGFDEKIFNITEKIVHHSCFHAYHMKKSQNESASVSIPLPMVYIASGVFSSRHIHSSNHFMTRRARKSLSLFRENGISHIITQQHLPAHVRSIALSLSPEQFAYVEQEVARRSACFVGADGTSWSYMVLRLKQMDRKRKLGEPLVLADRDLKEKEKSMGQFSRWGFRFRI